MRRVAIFAALCALAACDGESPYKGHTEQRRVDRNGDGGPFIYAKPVPGGCLYHSQRGMAFAPFECPPDAARWNRPEAGR